MTQFERGDRVRLRPEVTERSLTPHSGYGYLRIRPGETYLVTRAGNQKMMVRSEVQNESAWDYEHYYELAVPADPNAPKPRKLGTKPEGDEYLDPNDPRLEWFWDDVSTYANGPGRGYCGTFDSILKDLGLPPRKQKYTARGKLGPIEITGQVMAHSQEEADELFTKQIVASMREAASQLDAEAMT